PPARSRGRLFVRYHDDAGVGPHALEAAARPSRLDRRACRRPPAPGAGGSRGFRITMMPVAGSITPIVYGANPPNFGGANRVLTDLVNGLDRARFRPSIIAPTEGPLVDWARSRGVPCRIIPAGDHLGRAALLRRAAQMAPAVIGAGAHIVHAI